MTEETLWLICWLWIFIAVVVFFTMFRIRAPFGRHTSDKWGITINNRAGWVIMEAPSFLIMCWFLFTGTNSFLGYTWILFLLWMLHYFHRTFIYPFRIRSTPKKMPLFIVFSAIFFNLMNASLNGYYLAELAPVGKYNEVWLLSPIFIIGILMFYSGMVINFISDTKLINLRKPGETGYKIPQGFLFRYITAPNLFGEIIEWVGFAIMAWNLPALTFAVWTFANLVPRAKNHHDWYKEKFKDYPVERRVVFPFVF